MDRKMIRNASVIEAAKSLFRQFMKFGAVGVLNTTLFFALYFFFLNLIEPTSGYYLACLLSMVVAIFLNLKYTFEKRATARKVLMFVCVYVLSMYIGGLILPMLLGLSLSPQLAGLMTISFTVMTNFLGLKTAARWA
jgi:putative flippase GtrA